MKTFKNGRGLSLGSEMNQTYALLCLDELDHKIKEHYHIKEYGRYMDDTYIIGNSKEELKSLLDDIDKICKKQGIFINHKKTQLFRLDKGFTFLKIKYRLTDTGHLVRIPVKKNFIRERRKLKSFKNLLDKGLIDFHDIEEQYKSWKGNIQKYDCYKSLKNLDKVFNDLFLNNNSQNSH